MSLLLRHQPEKFGLSLDHEGFVSLPEMLAAIHAEPRWQGVTEEEILEVVTASDKQRFEIINGKIRARYGHSVPQEVTYPEIEPPEILYHGTAPGSLPGIRVNGLQSMKRQYVHLSTQVEAARQVGRRHSPNPVLLKVRARAAWQAGVPFYQPEPRLYLAKSIPPEFVEE